ncbi:MAG: TetR family transcriptional regulator [Pseudonocardiales bacterium]|nr:MAG: TetR family transcriptional regulator [Pseudonocardiales bacterium]
MRADAVSNRARILDSAEQVFAAGDDASTEQVARLAGVGIATVFRHFPTKAELLEAVLVTRLERLRDAAHDLGTATDPGAALLRFFARIVADADGKIAITEALAAANGNSGAAERPGAELRYAVGELLERAQGAGEVRRDIQLDELYALIVGTSRGAVAMALSPTGQRRMLDVVFAGLRTA